MDFKHVNMGQSCCKPPHVRFQLMQETLVVNEMDFDIDFDELKVVLNHGLNEGRTIRFILCDTSEEHRKEVELDLLDLQAKVVWKNHSECLIWRS